MPKYFYFDLYKFWLFNGSTIVNYCVLCLHSLFTKLLNLWILIVIVEDKSYIFLDECFKMLKSHLEFLNF